MATVRKSNKKKIIIPIAIVLIIAIVVGSVFATKASNGVKTVTLAPVSTDTITETVSATGEVSAGAEREYKTGAIANCKEVFVKVGDEVKQGDLLATFETDNLDTQVKSLQASYDSAKASYDSAVKAQAEAEKNLKNVNKRIKTLENQLVKLQNKKTTTTTKKPKTSETTTAATTTTTTKSTTQFAFPTTTTTTTKAAETTVITDISQLAGEISKSLGELTDTITKLSNDIQTTNEITRIVMTMIASEVASGNMSKDAIADAVGDAMSKAIKEGIIDETKLIVESGVAVEMVETAVKSVDWAAVGRGIGETDDVKMTSIQLQLAALYAEQELFSAQASGSLLSSQKQIMDSSKSALDTMKEAQKELEAGWTASMDGTITECNLTAGNQTNALETGIKLENMDTMVATISLGEYDIHKVKVGMTASITTAFGKYTGEIASIAPTATGGSSGSILDSVGSMAGIGGLSSLTASGAGVECKVTINNPDENIIIGFDADVEIQTGVYESVTVVPIESIVLQKDGTYVYKYNEEESTVTKTQIETGAISDTAYEVTSGITEGDVIVATPATDYEEDTFKVKLAK